MPESTRLTQHSLSLIALLQRLSTENGLSAAIPQADLEIGHGLRQELCFRAVPEVQGI